MQYLDIGMSVFQSIASIQCLHVCSICVYGIFLLLAEMTKFHRVFVSIFSFQIVLLHWNACAAIHEYEWILCNIDFHLIFFLDFRQIKRKIVHRRIFSLQHKFMNEKCLREHNRNINMCVLLLKNDGIDYEKKAHPYAN